MVYYGTMKLAKNIENKHLQLIEMDPQEKLVCIIKKHPVGLVPIFLTGFLISIVVLTATLGFGIWFERQLDFQFDLPVGIGVSIIGIIIAGLIIFFTFVASFIYQNNIIIVTSDKIAQIIYRNLVDRKISQLSLGDLQDVTVEQRGLAARLFKFGTLVIETAGEQNNYNFPYTPLPYECAKELVEAREASIKAYGN